MESQEKLTKLEALEITSSNFLDLSMDFHFIAETIQLGKPWKFLQASGWNQQQTRTARNQQ